MGADLISDAVIGGICIGVLTLILGPRKGLWARGCILLTFAPIAALMASSAPQALSDPLLPPIPPFSDPGYILARLEQLLLALAISFPAEWAGRLLRPARPNDNVHRNHL